MFSMSESGFNQKTNITEYEIIKQLVYNAFLQHLFSVFKTVHQFRGDGGSLRCVMS